MSGKPAFPNTTSSSSTPSCHRQLLCGAQGQGLDRVPGNPALFPPPLPQQPSRLSPLLPAASCSSLFVCGGLHTQIELPFFQSVQQCPEIHPQCNFCLGSSSSWNCLLFGSLGSMGVCDDNNPPAYITPFILQALGRQSRMKFGASVRPGGYSGR